MLGTSGACPIQIKRFQNYYIDSSSLGPCDKSIIYQEIKEQCDSIKKDIRNKNLSKTILNEKKRAFQEAHRKAQIIDNSSEKDPYLKEIIHHITKNNSLSSIIVGIQKEIDRKLEKFESK